MNTSAFCYLLCLFLKIKFLLYSQQADMYNFFFYLPLHSVHSFEFHHPCCIKASIPRTTHQGSGLLPINNHYVESAPNVYLPHQGQPLRGCVKIQSVYVSTLYQILFLNPRGPVKVQGQCLSLWCPSLKLDTLKILKK